MLLRALVLAEALLINHLGEREVNSGAGAASQDHIYKQTTISTHTLYLWSFRVNNQP